MRKLFSILLLAGLIITNCVAQNKITDCQFFFIQITDPQFGMYESDKGFSKETELYEKAVEAVNRLNPDFVVITGDLVNNRNDRGQIEEFKRITSKINKDIPVWYSPGNHDIGQSPDQASINSFIADYGHDRFSFNHKKNVFIGLNSCLIKSNIPQLAESQFEWLKKELKKGKSADHIILFTHYPFFINTWDEPESYSNIPVESRNKYLDLFKENHVTAVYAGHLHSNVSSKYGDIDFVVTGSSGKPLGADSSGFRVIKVYPDRIESTFYTLNVIPDKIF